MRSELFFQTSPWFILVCLIIGGLYAYFLYQPQPAWSKRVNRLLGLLRGLLVALICFLLLSPFLRTINSTVDKAKIVLAIDNSLSVGKEGSNAISFLNDLKVKLSASGYEVSSVNLAEDKKQEELDSIRFDQKKTDLSGLLNRVKSDFEGRNLTDVVLLSDGIANQGISPDYSTYPFRIHAVAVGDTVSKVDIQLRNVVANRIANMGNQFPVQADVVAHGLTGKSTIITLKQGGKVLASQNIVIDRNDFFASYTFTTSSAQKGIQHYTVEVAQVAGEHSKVNNRKEIYIDIIDGKEKVLLLALAPHPDIKALRAIIEKNENYELDVRTLSSGVNISELLTKPYDLIIFHQLPDAGGLGNDPIRKLLAKPVPVFFILGNQSSTGATANLSRTVQIITGSGQFDKVTGKFNDDFKTLNLDTEKLKLLEKLPPMSVPFGEYRLAQGSEVVLYQRVGSVRTNKPLLVLNTSQDRRVAVLMGEGLWLWRMEEFALTEKQEVVDELFEKIIQLLSVKEDKRKFRVYPLSAEFNEGEKVVFQTEIYNDIYEKIYGQDIRLEIIDENNKQRLYTYKNTEEAPRFEISGLPEGVYRFRASTLLRKGMEQVVGQFIIRNVDIELLNTTADFNLLRELAGKNGGQFVRPAEIQKIVDVINRHHPADQLESSEEMVELIHLKWLFFVLLLLATIEWGVRKYNGSY